MASNRNGGALLEESVRPEPGRGGAVHFFNEELHVRSSCDNRRKSSQCSLPASCGGFASSPPGVRDMDTSVSHDASVSSADHASDYDAEFSSAAATPVARRCTSKPSGEPSVCAGAPVALLSGLRPPCFVQSGASLHDASSAGPRVGLAASSTASTSRTVEHPAEGSSTGDCTQAAAVSALPSPFSLPSRLLLFLSSFIKEAFVSSIRRVVVGPLLKGLEEQQLHIALSKREVSVSHVQLQTDAANQLLAQAGVPIQFREVYVEQVQWLVPWRLRLRGLHAAVELVVDDNGTLCPPSEVNRGHASRDHSRSEFVPPPGDRRGCEPHQKGKHRSVNLSEASRPELDATNVVSSHSHLGTKRVSTTALGERLASHRRRSVPPEFCGAPYCDPFSKQEGHSAGASSAGMTHGSPPVCSAKDHWTAFWHNTTEKVSRPSGPPEGAYTMDDILRMLRRAMQTAVGALDLSLENITVSLFVPFLPDPRTNGEPHGRTGRRAGGGSKSQRRTEKGVRKRTSGKCASRGWVVRLHVESTRVCEVGQEGSSVRLEIEGLSGSLLSDAPLLFSPSDGKPLSPGERCLFSQPAGGRRCLSSVCPETPVCGFPNNSSVQERWDSTNVSSLYGSSRRDRGDRMADGPHSLHISGDARKVAEGGARSVLLHRKWLDTPGDLLFVTKPPIEATGSSLNPSPACSHGSLHDPETASEGAPLRSGGQKASGFSWRPPSRGINPLLAPFYSSRVGLETHPGGTSSKGVPDLPCRMEKRVGLRHPQRGDTSWLSRTGESHPGAATQPERRWSGTSGSRCGKSSSLMSSPVEASADRATGFDYGEVAEHMETGPGSQASGTRCLSRIRVVPEKPVFQPADAVRAERIVSCTESDTEAEPVASYSICGSIHIRPRDVLSTSASVGASPDPGRTWRGILGSPRLCSCLTAAIMTAVPRTTVGGSLRPGELLHLPISAPVEAASPTASGFSGIIDENHVPNSLSPDARSVSFVSRERADCIAPSSVAPGHSCPQFPAEFFSSCCGGEDLSRFVVSSCVPAPRRRHSVVTAAMAAGRRALSSQATGPGILSAAMDAGAAAGLDFAVHLRVPLVFSCIGIEQLRELVRLVGRISSVLQPPLRCEHDSGPLAGEATDSARHGKDAREDDRTVPDRPLVEENGCSEEETGCSAEEACQTASRESRSGGVISSSFPVSVYRNCEGRVCSQRAAEKLLPTEVGAVDEQSQPDPHLLSEMDPDRIPDAIYNNNQDKETDVKEEPEKPVITSGPVVACGASSTTECLSTHTACVASSSEECRVRGGAGDGASGAQGGGQLSPTVVVTTRSSLWSRLMYFVTEQAKNSLPRWVQQRSCGMLSPETGFLTHLGVEEELFPLYSYAVASCPSVSFGGEEIVPRLCGSGSGPADFFVENRGETRTNDGISRQPCDATAGCVATSLFGSQRDKRPPCGEHSGAASSFVCPEVEDIPRRPPDGDPQKRGGHPRDDAVEGWSDNKNDGEATGGSSLTSAGLPSSWLFHIEVERVRLHVVFSECFRASVSLRHGDIPRTQRCLSRPEFLRHYSETAVHWILPSRVSQVTEAERSGNEIGSPMTSAPRRRLRSPANLRFLGHKRDRLMDPSGRKISARVLVPFPETSFVTLVADHLVCSVVSSLPRCITQATGAVAASTAAGMPAQTADHRFTSSVPYEEPGPGSRSYAAVDPFGWASPVSGEAAGIRNRTAPVQLRRSDASGSGSVFSACDTPERSPVPACADSRLQAAGAAGTSTANLANATALHILLSSGEWALEMHLLKKRTGFSPASCVHNRSQHVTGWSEFDVRKIPFGPSFQRVSSMSRGSTGTVAGKRRAMADWDSEKLRLGIDAPVRSGEPGSRPLRVTLTNAGTDGNDELSATREMTRQTDKQVDGSSLLRIEEQTSASSYLQFMSKEQHGDAVSARLDVPPEDSGLWMRLRCRQAPCQDLSSSDPVHATSPSSPPRETPDRCVSPTNSSELLPYGTASCHGTPECSEHDRLHLRPEEDFASTFEAKLIVAPSDDSFTSVCESDDSWESGSDSSAGTDAGSRDKAEGRDTCRELDFEVFPLVCGVGRMADNVERTGAHLTRTLEGQPVSVGAPPARSQQRSDLEVPWTLFPHTVVPFPVPSPGETAFWSAHSLSPCSGGPCGRCCYARARGATHSITGSSFSSSRHEFCDGPSRSLPDISNGSSQSRPCPCEDSFFRSAAFETARKTPASQKNSLHLPGTEGDGVYSSFHGLAPSSSGAATEDSVRSCQRWNVDRFSCMRDFFPAGQSGTTTAHGYGDSPASELLVRHIPVQSAEAPLFTLHSSPIDGFPSGGKAELLEAPSLFLSISVFPSFHHMGHLQSGECLASCIPCSSGPCPLPSSSCSDQAYRHEPTDTNCGVGESSGIHQPQKLRRDFGGGRGLVLAGPYSGQSCMCRPGCEDFRTGECADGATVLHGENCDVQEGLLAQVNVKCQTTVVNLSLRAITEIMQACYSIGASSPASGGVELSGYTRLPAERPGRREKLSTSTACLAASFAQSPFPQVHFHLSVPCLRVNLNLDTGPSPTVLPEDCKSQSNEEVRSESLLGSRVPSAVVLWDLSALRITVEPDLLRLLFREQANGGFRCGAGLNSTILSGTAAVSRAATVLPVTVAGTLGALSGPVTPSLFCGGLLHPCSPGTLLDVQQVTQVHFVYADSRGSAVSRKVSVPGQLHHSGSPGVNKAPSRLSKALTSSHRPRRRGGEVPDRLVWRQSLLFSTCVSGTASSTREEPECNSPNNDSSCTRAGEAGGCSEAEANWDSVPGKGRPVEPSCGREKLGSNHWSSQVAHLEPRGDRPNFYAQLGLSSSPRGRSTGPGCTSDDNQARRASLFALNHLPVVPPSRVVLRRLIRTLEQCSGMQAASARPHGGSTGVRGGTATARPADELHPFDDSCSWSAAVDPGFWPDAAAPVASHREPLPPCPDIDTRQDAEQARSTFSVLRSSSAGGHPPVPSSGVNVHRSLSPGMAGVFVVDHGVEVDPGQAHAQTGAVGQWEFSARRPANATQEFSLSLGKSSSSARCSVACPPPFSSVSRGADIRGGGPIFIEGHISRSERRRDQPVTESAFSRSCNRLPRFDRLVEESRGRCGYRTSPSCPLNDTSSRYKGGACASRSRGRLDRNSKTLGKAVQKTSLEAEGDPDSIVGFCGSSSQASELPGSQPCDDSRGKTMTREHTQRRPTTVSSFPSSSSRGGRSCSLEVTPPRRLGSHVKEDTVELGVHLPLVYVPLDVEVAVILARSASVFGDSLCRWHRQWCLQKSGQRKEYASVTGAFSRCHDVCERFKVEDAETAHTGIGDGLKTAQGRSDVCGGTEKGTCRDCLPPPLPEHEKPGVGTPRGSKAGPPDEGPVPQATWGGTESVGDGSRMLRSSRFHAFIDAAVVECRVAVSSACSRSFVDAFSRVCLDSQGFDSPETVQVSSPSQSSPRSDRAQKNALENSLRPPKKSCDSATGSRRIRLELGRLRLHLGIVEKVSQKESGCGLGEQIVASRLSGGLRESIRLPSLSVGLPSVKTSEEDETRVLLQSLCCSSPLSRSAVEQRSSLCRHGGRAGGSPCAFQVEASVGSVCLFSRDNFPVFYTWRAALYQAAGKGRTDPGTASVGMELDALSVQRGLRLRFGSAESEADRPAVRQAPPVSTRGDKQVLEGDGAVVLGEATQVSSDSDKSFPCPPEPRSFFSCLLPRNSLVLSLHGRLGPNIAPGITEARVVVDKQAEFTEDTGLGKLAPGEDRVSGTPAGRAPSTSDSLACFASSSGSTVTQATLSSVRLAVGWLVAVGDVHALECLNSLLAFALLFTRLAGYPRQETSALDGVPTRHRDDACRSLVSTATSSLGGGVEEKTAEVKVETEGSFSDSPRCGRYWCGESCDVTVQLVRSVLMLPRPEGLTVLHDRVPHLTGFGSDSRAGQSCSVCRRADAEVLSKHSSPRSSQCCNCEGIDVQERREMFCSEAKASSEFMGWVTVLEFDRVCVRVAFGRRPPPPEGRQGLGNRECVSPRAGGCPSEFTGGQLLRVLDFRFGEVNLYLIDEGTELATSTRKSDVGTAGVTSRADDRCRDTTKLLRSVPPPSSLLPRLIPACADGSDQAPGQRGRCVRSSLGGLGADSRSCCDALVLSPLVVRAADISSSLRAIGLVRIASVHDLEGEIEESDRLGQRAASSFLREWASGLQVRVGGARFAFCPDSLRCFIQVAVDSCFVATLCKDTWIGVATQEKGQFPHRLSTFLHDLTSDVDCSCRAPVCSCFERLRWLLVLLRTGTSSRPVVEPARSEVAPSLAEAQGSTDFLLSGCETTTSPPERRCDQASASPGDESGSAWELTASRVSRAAQRGGVASLSTPQENALLQLGGDGLQDLEGDILADIQVDAFAGARPRPASTVVTFCQPSSSTTGWNKGNFHSGRTPPRHEFEMPFSRCDERLPHRPLSWEGNPRAVREGPMALHGGGVAGGLHRPSPLRRSPAFFEAEKHPSVASSNFMGSHSERGVEEDKAVQVGSTGGSQLATVEGVLDMGTAGATVRGATVAINEDYVAAPRHTQNEQAFHAGSKIWAYDRKASSAACNEQPDACIESQGTFAESGTEVDLNLVENDAVLRLSVGERHGTQQQDEDARRQNAELLFRKEQGEPVPPAAGEQSQVEKGRIVRLLSHSQFTPFGKNGDKKPGGEYSSKNEDEEYSSGFLVTEHSKDFSVFGHSDRSNGAAGTDIPGNTSSAAVSPDNRSSGWRQAEVLPPEGSVHWAVGAPGAVHLRPHFAVSGTENLQADSRFCSVFSDSGEESSSLKRTHCPRCVPPVLADPLNSSSGSRSLQGGAHSDAAQRFASLFRSGASLLSDIGAQPAGDGGPWKALAAELNKRGEGKRPSGDHLAGEGEAVRAGWRFAAQLLLSRVEVNLAKGTDFSGCSSGVCRTRVARSDFYQEEQCSSAGSCPFSGASSYGGTDQGDRGSKSGGDRIFREISHISISSPERGRREDVVEIVFEGVAVVYGRKRNEKERQTTRQARNSEKLVTADSGDRPLGAARKAARVASRRPCSPVTAESSAARLPRGSKVDLVGLSDGRNKLLCLKVHEFCVKDLVPNSMFTHMVQYFSDDRTRVRISSVPMLSVTLEEYRLPFRMYFPPEVHEASPAVRRPNGNVGLPRVRYGETEGESAECTTPRNGPVQKIQTGGYGSSLGGEERIPGATAGRQEVGLAKAGLTSGPQYFVMSGLEEQGENYTSEYALGVRLLPLALTLQQESLDAIEEMNQQMLLAGIVRRSQALIDDDASWSSSGEERRTTPSFSASTQRRSKGRCTSPSSRRRHKRATVASERTTVHRSSPLRESPYDRAAPADGGFRPGADWALVPSLHSPPVSHEGAAQPGVCSGPVPSLTANKLSVSADVDNDSHAFGPAESQDADKAHSSVPRTPRGDFLCDNEPCRERHAVRVKRLERERGSAAMEVLPRSEYIYPDVLDTTGRPCSFAVPSFHKQHRGRRRSDRTGEPGRSQESLFQLRDDISMRQQVVIGRRPGRAEEKPVFASARQDAHTLGRRVSNAFAGGLSEREMQGPCGGVSRGPGAVDKERASFLRSFDMAPALLRIDYVPRRLNPAGICKGQLQEVVNFLVSFCRVEGVEVILTRKSLTDLSSWGALLDQLLALWAEDFNRALMLKCMKGITPFRHVVRVTKMMKSVAQRLLEASVRQWRERQKQGKMRVGDFSQCGRSLRDWILEPGGTEIPQISKKALRHIAALLVAASAEGIRLNRRSLLSGRCLARERLEWRREPAEFCALVGVGLNWWSERAVRSAHSVLQLVDWRYTPGTCPPYPSSTSRVRRDSFSSGSGYAEENRTAEGFEQRVWALPFEGDRRRSDRVSGFVPLRGERSRTPLIGRSEGRTGLASLRSFSEITGDRRAFSLTDESEAGLTIEDGREHHLGSSEWSVVQLGAEGSYEPLTFRHGLRDGFCCIRRGVTSAAEAAERLCLAPALFSSSLARLPRREYGPSEEWGARRGVVPAAVVGREFIHALARLLPVFILRPMLGITEGIARTLQGTRNQLLPRLREERFEKLRKPSCRLQILEDDQDEDGVAPL